MEIVKSPPVCTTSSMYCQPLLEATQANQTRDQLRTRLGSQVMRIGVTNRRDLPQRTKQQQTALLTV
jgi:hypothetical protein